MTVQKLAYSVPEAAEACGISDQQMRWEIEAGRIPHVRFGARVVNTRHPAASGE